MKYQHKKHVKLSNSHKTLTETASSVIALRLIIPVVQEVGATDPVGQNSPNPHCTGWLELDPSEQNQPAVQRSVGAERPVVSQ